MSDFKIIGNANPIVGKEEFYSVDNFLPEALPFQNGAKTNRVQWEIYVLEHGTWRKTKENDKTGNVVSYKFMQKSLDRKGIRILARRGEDVGRLNVKTHPAEEPKIDKIELLDKNGKKPANPLSYGQTLKARVHCLHMEKRKVFVTLWEDDVDGGGHAKANEKNIIRTLPGIVKNGKADVDFVLVPSFAKIAKKDGKEDKIHEYYVTTDFNKEKIASKNVDVNDLETPVAPFKKKVPVQQPAKPKTPVQQPVQPKSNKPVTSSPPAKEKAEITNVHITDTAGHAISGVHKQKEIKVWIDSKGLIGKDIRLKLFDEDDVSNDLLFDQKFTIKSNIYSVVVPLNEILRSKGGDNIFEGSQQEVFAYVEVIGTKKNKPSEVVQVDVKVFKPDPIEATNKVKKVGENDKKDDKKDDKNSVCECEARVKAFMRMLRVGEGTEGEKGYTTAFNNNIIKDLSTHPKTDYGGSTAAGAYQIMRYTYAWLGGSKLEWTGKYFKILDIYEKEHDYIKRYSINDYKPESQDKLCICLMKDKKGMMELIIAGKIEDAIRKYGSSIWASLPHKGDNSRYEFKGKPQPATPIKECLSNYNAFFKEEMQNKSDLHLKKGFLKEFNYNCCKGEKEEKVEKVTNAKCSCGQTHYDNAKPEHWIHQEPSECWAASVKILKNYGIVGGGRTNCIIIANQKDKVLTPVDAQKGIDYIDSQLKKGNPVVVGLDDNLRKTTYNVHKATDHFFVIVGSGCEDGKRFYNFFDVGSKTRDKGTDSSNKLTIKDNLLIQGKSNGGTHNYTITEIRRNN
jgi:muramidase (phage lysozyme)